MSSSFFEHLPAFLCNKIIKNHGVLFLPQTWWFLLVQIIYRPRFEFYVFSFLLWICWSWQCIKLGNISMHIQLSKYTHTYSFTSTIISVSVSSHLYLKVEYNTLGFILAFTVFICGSLFFKCETWFQFLSLYSRFPVN